MSGGGSDGGVDLAGTAIGLGAGGPMGGLIGSQTNAGSFLGDVRDSLTGKKAADAQERIAMAQLEEQRRTRDLATKAAEPTPQEMQQLERSIALNEQDISRKQKLLDSADPALIEAGQQALKLLQGQDAKTLDPIKRQREKERLKLQEKLQAQLGPGFENTTAGIQALSAFDEATTNALGTAQQQSLAQLLGVAQTTSAGNGMQNNISNSGTLASLFGNQSNRRVAAITGTPVTAAGAQFVGDLQQARSEMNLANTALNGGLAYMTSGASAAGGSGTAGKITPGSSAGTSYFDPSKMA